jgi:hypothetical protein
VVLRADFLSLDVERRFDVATCWSGFGVGPDAEHLALLRRLPGWLAERGVAFIDVFDPSGWRARRGFTRVERGFGHRLDYDDATGRLTDEWWRDSRPDQRVRNEIRCYERAEFAALAATADLRATAVSPSIGAPAGAAPPSYLYILRLA